MSLKYAAPIDPNKEYKVYRNLNKKCWSVRDSKDHVVAHLDGPFIMTGAKFVVRKAGQATVRRTRQKDFHAYAKGKIVELDTIGGLMLANEISSNRNRIVTYNPMSNNYFISICKTFDTIRTEIHESEKLLFLESGVLLTCLS